MQHHFTKLRFTNLNHSYHLSQRILTFLTCNRFRTPSNSSHRNSMLCRVMTRVMLDIFKFAKKKKKNWKIVWNVKPFNHDRQKRRRKSLFIDIREKKKDLSSATREIPTIPNSPILTTSISPENHWHTCKLLADPLSAKTTTVESHRRGVASTGIESFKLWYHRLVSADR